MSIITDENTFFNNSTETLPWKGQYTGSTGTQDFVSTFTVPPATTYGQTEAFVAGTSYAKLTHGFNTYFKMQGFNPSTQSYEVWFSTGAPLLTPPSTHPLTNIQIVLTWIDR